MKVWRAGFSRSKSPSGRKLISKLHGILWKPVLPPFATAFVGDWHKARAHEAFQVGDTCIRGTP
eukprot:1366398-Amphidinium_carterae.1